MSGLKRSIPGAGVALRKESVDRNVAIDFARLVNGGSLSARRAWIEMAVWAVEHVYQLGRSPQGERG